MRKSLVIACSLILAVVAGKALADLSYTQGAGTTIFDFICFTSKHCSAHVLVDSTGTEKLTTGNVGYVDTGVSGNLINAIKSPPGLGTSGGWTPLTKTGLTTTVTAIKASAGQLGFAQCDNGNNSASYIQIFNLAAGSVTLGVTVPTQVMPIPANLSNGFVMNLVGMQYSTAISVAATTTATGSGAPSTALNCTFGFN